GAEAVGSARSAVLVLPPVRFCGPPAEPGVPVVPAPGSPRVPLSGCCGVTGPRVADLRPPESVAFDGHRRGFEERDPIGSGPPLAGAVVAVDDPSAVPVGVFGPQP